MPNKPLVSRLSVFKSETQSIMKLYHVHSIYREGFQQKTKNWSKLIFRIIRNLCRCAQCILVYRDSLNRHFHGTVISPLAMSLAMLQDVASWLISKVKKR